MKIDKVGQRVQIKDCPEHRGTISSFEPGHSFVIIYDNEERRRGEPRTKHSFSMSEAARFVPDGSIKTRIIDSEDSTGSIDIPAALAKKYGIGK